VAARVRIPLGLPMKTGALIFSLFLVAACGGSDQQVGAKPTGIAATIADVVCETSPKMKPSSIPSTTKESWQCERAGQAIKFDVYLNEDEKARASSEALALLGVTGDNQNWSQTPILCGAEWTMGVADIKTRDELITELNTAGVSASTC
jgi:hypothetical protein